MAKGRLAGQRALVTGASSGIGEALARRLAREGCDLLLVARREDRLLALAQELRGGLGIDARVEALDLGAPGAGEELFRRTEGHGVTIDILVNNAGFGDYDDYIRIPWEKHAGMLQVNVVVLSELTHRFAARMVERGRGCIMNVASVGAYMPTPTFACYTASKAYVRNLTEAIDYELAGTGVRAMVLNPGGTHTEFLDVANQKLKGGADAFMMTAEQCADIGVRGMLAGKRNVVTGFFNQLTCFVMRLVPRRLQAHLAYQGMQTGVERAGPQDPALPAPKG